MRILRILGTLARASPFSWAVALTALAILLLGTMFVNPTGTAQAAEIDFTAGHLQAESMAVVPTDGGLGDVGFDAALVDSTAIDAQDTATSGAVIVPRVELTSGVTADTAILDGTADSTAGADPSAIATSVSVWPSLAAVITGLLFTIGATTLLFRTTIRSAMQGLGGYFDLRNIGSSVMGIFGRGLRARDGPDAGDTSYSMSEQGRVAKQPSLAPEGRGDLR